MTTIAAYLYRMIDRGEDWRGYLREHGLELWGVERGFRCWVQAVSIEVINGRFAPCGFVVRRIDV